MNFHLGFPHNNPPSPCTRSGCNTPYCFMDSASSSNASSSNFFLGCSLFGSTFVIFIMIASAACSLFGVGLFFEAAGFVFTLSVIRESKPFPNPFFNCHCYSLSFYKSLRPTISFANLRGQRVTASLQRKSWVVKICKKKGSNNGS